MKALTTQLTCGKLITHLSPQGRTTLRDFIIKKHQAPRKLHTSQNGENTTLRDCTSSDTTTGVAM